MMAHPRPSPALTDDERLAAILSEAEDKLVLLQIPTAQPDVVEILDAIRYVRGQLLKRLPAEVDHGQEVGE